MEGNHLPAMTLHNLRLFISIILWLIILLILGLSFVSVEAAPQLIHNSIINQRLLSGRTLFNDTAAAIIESQARDPFYGISTAQPGTFDRIIRNFFLRILSSATTPATWTTPISTTPSIAARAGTAISRRSLLLSLLYGAWFLGSYTIKYWGGW